MNARDRNATIFFPNSREEMRILKSELRYARKYIRDRALPEGVEPPRSLGSDSVSANYPAN
jgi:hypothetical protein